jgi:hypothetical protein
MSAERPSSPASAMRALIRARPPALVLFVSALAMFTFFGVCAGIGRAVSVIVNVEPPAHEPAPLAPAAARVVDLDTSPAVEPLAGGAACVEKNEHITVMPSAATVVALASGARFVEWSCSSKTALEVWRVDAADTTNADGNGPYCDPATCTDLGGVVGSETGKAYLLAPDAGVAGVAIPCTFIVCGG